MTIQESSDRNTFSRQEIDIVSRYSNENLRVGEHGRLETYELSWIFDSALLGSRDHKEAEEKVLQRISLLSKVVCKKNSFLIFEAQVEKLAFLNGLKKIHEMHKSPSIASNHTYEVLLSGIERQIADYREAYEASIFLNCKDGCYFSFTEGGELCLSPSPVGLSDEELLLAAKKAFTFLSREVNHNRLPSISQIDLLDRILGGREPFHSLKEEYVSIVRKLEGFTIREEVVFGEGGIQALHEKYAKLGDELEVVNSLLFCKQFDLKSLVSGQREAIIEERQTIKAKLAGIAEKCLLAIPGEIPKFEKETEILPLFIQCIQKNLKELLDYVPGRTFLYVDGERLQRTSTYVMASFDKSVQDEVLSLIDHQLQDFVSVLKEGTCDRDILESVYGQLVCGLRAVLDDYKSYPEFSERLGAISEAFEMQLCFREAPESSIKDIDELFSSYCSFRVEALITVLSSIYGGPLVERVFAMYLEGDKEVIDRMTLKLLVCAIATEVSSSDLFWLKLQPGYGDKDTAALLNHFRKAPDGSSLFKYFNIPLCRDKRNILHEYLAKLPEETEMQALRKIAVETLADMESAVLWKDDAEVVMDKEEVLQIIHTFIESSIPTYAFNSDYYLNFLTVAAAVIAWVQDGSVVNDRLLAAMIHKLDHMHAGSLGYYSEKYSKHYAACWSKLSSLLKDPESWSGIYMANLLEQLKKHPFHETEGELMSVEEYSERMKLPEFFARKVGYWNKHALQRSLFLDDATGELKDESVKFLRKGTLVESLSGEESTIWELCEVYNEKGVACQVFLPIDIERYAEKGESVPLWITFQGTIGQSNSYSRDTEVIGPGNSFWACEENADLMTRLVDPVIARCEGVTFDIWTTGHSLGGADSMNACCQLAEAYCESPLVNTINCTTFNTAGMTKAAARKYLEHLGPDGVGAAKRGWILHSLVRGDVVETSGQTKLGKGLVGDGKVIFGEVKNHCTDQNSVYDALNKHCDLVYVKGSRIQPVKVLHPEVNLFEIRRYLKGIGRSTFHFLNVADETLDKHWLTQFVPNTIGGFFNLFKGVLSFRSMMTKEELAGEIAKLRGELKLLESQIGERSLSWFQRLKGDSLSEEEQEDLEKLEDKKAFKTKELLRYENELDRLNRMTEEEYQGELRRVEETNAYAREVASYGLSRLGSIPYKAWYGDHRFQILEQTD